MCSWNFVVIGRQCSAQNRVHTQHGIESSGDELPLDPFCLAVQIHPEPTETPNSKYPGKYLVVIAKSLEGRVGKASRSPFRVNLDELDQFLRILDRHHSQHDGVDQAEDGRIGANAESQCQHRYRSEAGILPKHAKRVMKVVKHRGSGLVVSSPRSKVQGPKSRVQKAAALIEHELESRLRSAGHNPKSASDSLIACSASHSWHPSFPHETPNPGFIKRTKTSARHPGCLCPERPRYGH